MKPLKSAASYTLYKTVESPLTNSEVLDNIHGRRRVPLTPANESSVGWGVFTKEEGETPFTTENTVFGNIVALSFCQDSYSVPKSAVKRELKRTISLLPAEPKKSEMVELEMKVRADLRARSFPRTRYVRVLWDRSTNLVRIFTCGAQREAITSLFERTFGVALNEQNTFGRYKESSLCTNEYKIPNRMTATSSYDNTPNVDGYEFLTFLYADMVQQERVTEPGFGLEFFKAKIVPVFHEGAVTSVLTGGKEKYLKIGREGPELADAFRRGGLISQLGVACSSDDTGNLYRFQLNADISIKGLKCPDFKSTVEGDQPQGRGKRGRKKKGEQERAPIQIPMEDVLEFFVAHLAVVEDLVTRYFIEFLQLRTQGPCAVSEYLGTFFSVPLPKAA